MILLNVKNKGARFIGLMGRDSTVESCSSEMDVSAELQAASRDFLSPFGHWQRHRLALAGSASIG